MTHLRQIMLEELRRRNYAESTIHAYIHTVVQFHDILYKTFRDILYTWPAGGAVRVGILEHGCIGSNSQIRVRR